MTRRVLSVGQCVPDQAALVRFLQGHFAVQIDTAATAPDALDALRKRPADLVLINRKLDEDYTDGTEIIRAMKADPELASLPVMLISNYPEYQDNAVALGAVYGFGKSDLSRSDVVERLRPYLA